MVLRRDLLKALAAVPAATSLLPPPGEPLRVLAARRNILFGAAVTVPEIGDAAYASLLARECAVITPGIEAKWAFTEPAEGAFRFGPMDALTGFAAGAGLKLHMHNLVWAVGLPDWTNEALKAGRGIEILRRHIGALAARYKSHTVAWDVVNEPADPRWPAGPEGLCTTPWRVSLGPGFVAEALAMAAEADPGARLLVNDDDLEYDTDTSAKKRATYLRLIELWLRAGAKLHGFGLEAHLRPWLPIAHREYRRFLRDLASMGLEIWITELDVCDRLLPADTAIRDGAVAALTRDYLDLALDEPAVRAVITWGLTDRTTWMTRDRAGKRADGLPPRPLPYDATLRPKPMRSAMAQAFAAAPARPGRA